MPDRSRWETWLYETHTPSELHEWATRLRYFRFCRANGGHGNDGDELRVAVRGETEDALHALFGVLGITANRIALDAPDPQPGVGYTVAEYQAFPSRIDRFPHLAQPGHVEIDGQKAFVWAHSGRLTISLRDPDDIFAVTARTVESALVVERTLAPIGSEVIDPPFDDRHCICPKHYPELWG